MVSAALTVMLYRNKETQAVKKWENVAYSLIIGGALGNAIDRAVDKCSLLSFTPDEPYNRLNVCQGYVVDFLIFIGIGTAITLRRLTWRILLFLWGRLVGVSRIF